MLQSFLLSLPPSLTHTQTKYENKYHTLTAAPKAESAVLLSWNRDGMLSKSRSKCWRHWIHVRNNRRLNKKIIWLIWVCKDIALHISTAVLENTTKLNSEANLRKLNNYISLQRSINILHIRDNEHQWLQNISKINK